MAGRHGAPIARAAVKVAAMARATRRKAKGAATARKIRTVRAIARAANLAPTIKTIRASAARSLRAIATELNRRGIPTSPVPANGTVRRCVEYWSGCEPTERAGLMPRRRRTAAGELWAHAAGDRARDRDLRRGQSRDQSPQEVPSLSRSHRPWVQFLPLGSVDPLNFTI
jgi:hypothetical protein